MESDPISLQMESDPISPHFAWVSEPNGREVRSAPFSTTDLADMTVGADAPVRSSIEPQGLPAIRAVVGSLDTGSPPCDRVEAKGQAHDITIDAAIQAVEMAACGTMSPTRRVSSGVRISVVGQRATTRIARSLPERCAVAMIG